VKIAIIGRFGGVHLGTAFATAFRDLGHEVQEIDPLAGSSRVPIALAADRAGSLVGRAMRRAIGLRLLTRVRPADVILVLKDFAIAPATWPALRRRTGATLVNFNPDNPFVFNGSSGAPYLVQSIPLFDLYLLWSRALVEQARRAGARRAEFLPFATDPAQYYPVEVSETERRELGAPVCFVGNWDEERERWVDAVCKRGLVPSVWGSSWERARSPWVKKAWRGGGAIEGEKLRKVIAASTIHLNLLRNQNKSGHNMRTFEIPACGAFLLTERSDDLPLLFREGEEVEAYSTPDELVAKARRYLGDPQARARIARAGHARALANTYRDRAREILQMLGRH
jgi:hypothetical protein